MHYPQSSSSLSKSGQRCSSRPRVTIAALWQQQAQRPRLPAISSTSNSSSSSGPAVSTTANPASPPGTKAQDTVTVYFRQEGTSTQAKPGEDFLEVASRCSADIPTGCLHGSCGVCEVELFRYSGDGSEASGPVVLRACVAKVPRGWSRVEVGMLAADAIWGQDGWDT